MGAPDEEEGRSLTHQVGTQHEEADEVQVGQVAAAGVLLPGLNVGFRVAASSWKRSQHDLLPLFSGGTPGRKQGSSVLTFPDCREQKEGKGRAE